MAETVMVHSAHNFITDLANYTPAAAEKGYLSAARYMSPLAKNCKLRLVTTCFN